MMKVDVSCKPIRYKQDIKFQSIKLIQNFENICIFFFLLVLVELTDISLASFLRLSIAPFVFVCLISCLTATVNS